jgi:hypothetical protein
VSETNALTAALLEMMRRNPEVARSLARAHTPDPDGRCRGCSYAGRVTSRECFLGMVASRALTQAAGG